MSFATTCTKSRAPALLLLIALAACSKQEPAATPAATADQTAAPAAAAPPQAEQVAAEEATSEMSAEQLRAAANAALADNRIYSPGGNNALEYYLAARAKDPDDPAVLSALTDLLPYTIIAAEQSIVREDFAEAQRLSALIERADAKAPSLPRLKQSIANAQAAVGRRSAEETARAQELARKQEEERRTQQAEQQRQAAEALAAQQEQQRQAAAAREAAEREAAAQREAAARAAAAPAPAAPAAAPPPPAPAPAALRVLNAPPPRYPAEAQRAGTAGEVMIELTVATDGTVSNARVVRSSPPRVFDREALNAVRRWRFAPIPEPITTRRTINFQPGE